MDTQPHTSDLGKLLEAFAVAPTQLPSSALQQAGQLCLDVFSALGQVVHQRAEAPLVLAFSQLVEDFSQQLHREQLALAVDAEVCGAHTLAIEQYDALRAGTADLDAAAQHVIGRPCYKDPADLLSAWLRIDYFEAARRIADAHLVVARRTMAGERTAARYPELAQQYQDTDLDPRRVLKSARAIDKLEPQDTIFDGLPVAATARAADGRLLEQHAAQLLAEQEPRAGQKMLSNLITDYKKSNQQLTRPELGLFIRPQRNGVHEFVIRAMGVDAERIRSLIAQADNPRTQAGAAARVALAASQGSTATAPATAADQQVPEWLVSSDPPPDWALEPDPAAEPSHSGPEQASAAPLPGDEVQQDAAVDVEAGLVPVPTRRLNALLTLLKHPGGGTKTVTPEIIVHMQLDDLQDLATAHGVTAHGITLEATELRQLLCEAKIIPMVFNGKGQVLDMGRAQRLFPAHLRKAILARDGGCIVPGCTVSPEHVEIHHFPETFENGCPTSVATGTPVCINSHHAEHAGQIKIVLHNGLPHVILPKHIDPEQKPQRNQYWQNKR